MKMAVSFAAVVRAALVLLVVCSATAFAQSKKPITHETLWLMKRVGAPVPSPDGKWVVFSVTEPAYDEKDQVSDLWIVPTDGAAPPRRLTASKSGESGVAWSPDSQKIAFSARRDGEEAAQIYILNIVAGGEAMRATSLSTGAQSPQWRPDGKAILFTSRVFPGAADDEANKKIAAERKARKYKARAYDSFPIRNWDRWIDDTQMHVFVQSLDGGAPAKDLLAGTALVKEPGFAGKTTSGSDDIEPIWSPDGQAVIFTATTARNAAAYAFVDTHLYMIAAMGGEPKRLTSGSASFTAPKFRPDGKALYCSTSVTNGKVYNLDRIAMLPWPPTGDLRVMTASFDRSVSGFAFAPDSKTIYLTAEDAGHEKLYAMPSEGGEVRLAFDMALGVYANLAVPESAAAPILLANWESAVNPSEIVRIDVAAKSHKALTAFNAEAAAGIDWQSPRHFWFTSKTGKKIHNMLVLPPNFSDQKKYPLFALIHGGPHSMWRDQFFLRWNYHLIAQPGFVVLLTDYTGSTGYGEKFAQDIQGDPLKTCGSELNEAVDEAVKQFAFVDGNRLAAGGASYGGHLANWLQATTTRYKCLVSHAGLINLESQWGTSDTIYSREINNGGPVWEQGPVWREQNPIRYAAKFKTPILITVGENDFRVPLNQTLENWSALQRMRVPSRLIVFPDANHWILKGEDSRYFYQELHDWLKKYLQP